MQWNEDETEFLVRLVRRGFSDLEISRKLDCRSQWAIGKRRRRLGLRKNAGAGAGRDEDLIEVVPIRDAIHVSCELLKLLVLHHRDRTPATLKRFIVENLGKNPPKNWSDSPAPEPLVVPIQCHFGSSGKFSRRVATGSTAEASAKLGQCGPASPCLQAAAILQRVAEEHRISVELIKGPEVDRQIATARQEAYYRLRMETDFSYPQIGRILGGRDHSSVMHGVRRHADRFGLPVPGRNPGNVNNISQFSDRRLP